MSNAGRLGLVALAVAVAAVAFVVARPGDDDDGQAGGPPATETTDRPPDGQPTATAPSAPEPPPDGPDRPPAVEIELRDHAPVDGVERIEVVRGERVRLVVRSDTPDEIHVHGYDIERQAAPGSPARFSFRATIEGIFEVESHEAEHHGVEPLIARLVVEPS